MNKIKRAIIMASGLGTRLRPLTLTVPKPLLKVGGVVMIESIIDGLLANNISEIHIVTGYLKDCFAYLPDKYPNADIDLIFNEDYQECNNISSLYVARNFLDETMIIDGDQIIKNQEVLTPFFERSGYNSVYITQGTNEWLQQTKNGTVVSCSRNGGQCGFQLYGISRWTKRDSFQLRQDLELEFVQKHNHQAYWDDVAMFCHPDHYQLGIFEMSSSDVIEIDSIKDLEALNESLLKERSKDL